MVTKIFTSVGLLTDVTPQSINNYIPYYEKPTYNCTIPRVVQGEWYSREKNLDTVTIIDASQMQRRGICVEHETDYTGKYTFLFSENPKDRTLCYHCVRIYVRTVNILEKRESKDLVSQRRFGCSTNIHGNSRLLITDIVLFVC